MGRPHQDGADCDLCVTVHESPDSIRKKENMLGESPSLPPPAGLAGGGTAGARVVAEAASADALLVPGMYNGCFFDVAASQEGPIIVTALHVAGTRGMLRAFATRRSESQVYAMTDWRQWVAVGSMAIGDGDDAPEGGGGYRNNNNTNRASFHPASAPVESVVISLDQPVPIAAGEKRGFHVHLAYEGGARLATKEVLEPLSVVAKDLHASVLAGAGYIGFTPFFTRQADGVCDGQWRDGRSLLGGIAYERPDTTLRAGLRHDRRGLCGEADVARPLRATHRRRQQAAH